MTHRTIKPKTGRNHPLFGVHFLNMHNIRDPSWTPYEKFTQYMGLTQLHEKDQTLTTLKNKADGERKTRAIQSLRREIKDDREKLNVAYFGDSQRTKNIVQNHKELQRLYPNMPAHLMIENMDQRTFVKRKELDRLIHKRNQLSKKYEEALIELANLQDRVKYEDVIELKNDVLSKRLRMELKNTQTRIRAISNINKAYSQLINTMMHDSLYFETVLVALEDDITEQQNFISTTVQLGLPALANFEQLTQDYTLLERKTRSDFRSRMDDMKVYYEKIQENNMKVKELVRRDSDFEIFPERYARETDSMIKLKRQLENTEKEMKAVKKITSCKHAEEVMHRMKRQVQVDKQIMAEIKRLELEKDAAEKKDLHSRLVKECLTHNLTAEDEERWEHIKELKEDIQQHVTYHAELQDEIKKKSEVIELLSFSFQHILDVVRHVGEQHTAERKAYSNIDLNLPLLQFNAFPPKVIQPQPTEEDPDTLLKIIKDRVILLMNAYKQETATDEEIHKSGKIFHNDVLKDYQEEEANIAGAGDASAFIEVPTFEDPMVPTRLKIKGMSKKIVEANTKMED